MSHRTYKVVRLIFGGIGILLLIMAALVLILSKKQ